MIMATVTVMVMEMMFDVVFPGAGTSGALGLHRRDGALRAERKINTLLRRKSLQDSFIHVSGVAK